MNRKPMTRDQLLATEIFTYSYDDYANHLGIGNQRIEKYMPDAAKALERAEKEGWSDQRLAKAIEVEVSEIPQWRKASPRSGRGGGRRQPRRAFSQRRSSVDCARDARSDTPNLKAHARQTARELPEALFWTGLLILIAFVIYIFTLGLASL